MGYMAVQKWGRGSILMIGTLCATTTGVPLPRDNPLLDLGDHVNQVYRDHGDAVVFW